MNKDKDFTAMDKDKEIICISSRGGEPGINEHGKDLVSAEQRPTKGNASGSEKKTLIGVLNFPSSLFFPIFAVGIRGPENKMFVTPFLLLRPSRGFFFFLLPVCYFGNR
ncbi:MAG: hypothetical protein MJ053_06940 [Elusimicrobiaceae bacterium]|nr:hypothetical protein [Elusimicrobiaceae bacterium]